MTKATRKYIAELREAAHRNLLRRVHEGELVSASVLAERMGVSSRQLAHLERRGGIYSVDLDGTPFYPALFASPNYDQRRLRRVSHIIYPAPPEARLGFLMSRCGSLGDIAPLEALSNDDSYRRLLAVAKAWAAEWWRTIVVIYPGQFANRDTHLPTPVCTGAVDADPRISVWRRAADALSCVANMRPCGPYPPLNAATIKVTKRTSGSSKPVPELELEVERSGALYLAKARMAGAEWRALVPIPAEEADDIVTAVRKLLAKATE
ncbi:hypothetical protein [Paraburkholderia sp. BR14374]|uniref:hypothetical protein n=1 Tax=Paraburkholderia sp. BR14374 TaxID=3237007 RepID=UPI0034CF813B